ncbi:phage protease, partial [Campylobacter jejuni]|nr:phage protease [Campylobacter jejuni]
KNLASSLVDNALNSGKIANSQKEWALMYACKDLEGFKSFLDAKNDQVQVPKIIVLQIKTQQKLMSLML